MNNANCKLSSPQLKICSLQFAICNLLSRTFARRRTWLVLTLGLLGCNRGPQLAPITGRVTLDGKPLDVAEVTFQPETGTGSASYGRSDQNGHYEVLYSRAKKGALVGSHTVRIRSATELTGPNGQSTVRPQLVPPRYNSNSALHREVVAGKNEFDFDLKSEPKTSSSK